MIDIDYYLAFINSKKKKKSWSLMSSRHFQLVRLIETLDGQVQVPETDDAKPWQKLAEISSSQCKLYSVSPRYNLLCGEAYSVWKEWWVMKSWRPGVSCAPLGLIISAWHPMFYMERCCPGNNTSHLILKHHFICPCQFVWNAQVGPKRLFNCKLWVAIQILFIPIEY